MKENKIEKLILDLSTRWDCSPQEAVDRLNSMNESEINKLIKDMAKKFQMGGSLEDRVAFGTTERPRKFNPTEINPISKREAMQKYAGFGYDRGQLKRIYNRAAEYLGKDNAAKWMSAAWDQRAPGQTGYLVPVKEQLPWEKAPAMQSGIEMPVTNSDPQYYNGPRNFKFKNGGMIDCLRNGGSVEKCKCGCDKITKAQGGKGELGKGIVPEVKPGGLKGFFWQPQEYPRVENFDYLDGKFTGTKSWYYDQDGNEHQILNKVFPAGNTASTELLIKNPGTPVADSVMTITNQYGKRTIKDMKDAVKFLPAFEKNFKCGGSLPKKNNTKK